MTPDPPIWICAYGNNQHALNEDVTKDLRDSGFTKAIHVAQGCTITILDTSGVVFLRIWCVFELFQTLVDAPKASNEGEVDDLF